MPTVLRQLEQHAYGGDAADGLPVRGACARTVARRRGLDAPRGGGRVGVRATSGRASLGRRVTLGGVGTDARALPAVAGEARRAGARCRVAPTFCLLLFLLVLFLK
jgi:hypothetical protein